MSMTQKTLFGDIESPALSISEAAEQIAVSTATIRNWIKTGLIGAAGTSRVDLGSFESFQKDMTVNGKLSTRANKLHKSPHNHLEISEKIFHGLTDGSFSLDAAGTIYEQSLSDAYRNKEGIYYTPQHIVTDMFRSISGDISEQTFCDPCCGCGNFILHAINHGFPPDRVYGFDVDSVAVEITKQRILEKTGYVTDRIRQMDFLDFATAERERKFDNIFTNPPWGKKLPKQQRELLGQALRSGKSIDTCSLFFFACLKVLCGDGKLGLLLPESFFNIAVFEDARAKSLSLKIERLIDYEKPFKGLVTKACGLVLTNQLGDSAGVVCETTKTKTARSISSFLKNPKSILNIRCSSESASVIEYIYSHDHCLLQNNATWGLGIVTGNNKRFCRTHNEYGYMPVFRGADITKDGLKSPTCYIPDDLSLYQQVAPKELFLAKDKLIYKFISSRLCFFYDDKQRFILNSANLVIPRNDFPITGKQLCDLLNSRVVNWVFEQIFGTHKILRSDVETLPIHYAYFNQHDTFSEKSYCDYLNIERCKDGTFRIKR